MNEQIALNLRVTDDFEATPAGPDEKMASVILSFESPVQVLRLINELAEELISNEEGSHDGIFVALDGLVGEEQEADHQTDATNVVWFKQS